MIRKYWLEEEKQKNKTESEKLQDRVIRETERKDENEKALIAYNPVGQCI